MMKITFFILFLVLTSACVKEDGKISDADSTGGTTGSTSGGSTTGSVSSGQTDPLYSQAWHLDNTGQSGFSLSSGTAGHDINVKEVHEDLDILGRGVRVAVSDSGVDITHADLNDNLLLTESRNYVSDLSTDWLGASPDPSGDDSHGTAVSGLIAAEGWNSIGSRGVAPSAKFAAFRYVYGPSSETTASRKAKEIDQLYGEFDIFNFSYGRAGYVFIEEDEDVLDAVKLGVTTLRSGKGTTYVQSAGNSREEYYEYCDHLTDPLGALCYMNATGNSNAHESLTTPYKIVVSAIDAKGKSTTYSTTGSNVWVSAPGGEDGIAKPAMVTTDIAGCSTGLSFRSSIYAQYFDFGFNSLNLQCDYTNRMNGTSSAAPVTTGVIALMLEANPNLTWRDIKHILAVTADQIDYDPLDNFLDHPLGYDIGGYQYEEKWIMNAALRNFSNYYGFGRVDAGGAVAMAKSYNLATLGTFEQTKNSSDTWYYSADHSSTPLPIADESSVATTDQIWVGHNYIIESIQIAVTSDHPFPGDLAIHLVSPSGTESRLMNINNKIAGDASTFDEKVLLSNAFYGEESNGYWTIKIYDGDSLFATGDLIEWKILVSGHKKSTDLAKPYPATFLTLSATPIADTITPAISFSNSESTVLRYEASVGLTPNDEAIKGWTTITSGAQLTGLSPMNDGQTYYLKLRAVGPTGLSSSVQVKSWTADTI
jgi:subtilisin family serine protease